MIHLWQEEPSALRGRSPTCDVGSKPVLTERARRKFTDTSGEEGERTKKKNEGVSGGPGGEMGEAVTQEMERGREKQAGKVR